MMKDDRHAEIPPAVAGFLADSLGIVVDEARVLRGGARHRVLRVGGCGRRVVVKLHGPQRDGFDDGFAREVLMHGFIARHGGGRVPALLAHDAALRCVVFEWIDGTPLRGGHDAGMAELAAMADFLIGLNRPAALEQARAADLPVAAEGGLRQRDHLDCARRRIDRLLGLDPATSPHHPAMQSWVREVLSPEWDQQAEMISRCDEPPVAAVLSPSDFGRHNTLRACDGALWFIDFEHAGWDDPAKLAADFILQPDHPLDEAMAGFFLNRLTASACFPGELAARTRQLLAVQRIKWATIVLNRFVHGGHDDGSSDELLHAALEKARDYQRRPLPQIADGTIRPASGTPFPATS